MKVLWKKICEVIGKTVIHTGLFLLILFIVERLGLYAIFVSDYNRKLIYPGEVGGFFFILLLIASVSIEGIICLINLIRKYKVGDKN